MPKHENPQAPAPVFTPPSQVPPMARHGVQIPKRFVGAEAAQQDQESAAPVEDLGDVIRGIMDMSRDLFESFFAVPDVAEASGRVDPQKFDAATRLAFINCGNALDYATRLVSDKGSAARIALLKRQLSEEMRAAGMTGDPGESPM